MIALYNGESHEVQVKVYKLQTSNLEDFSRADTIVLLVGDKNKIPMDYTIEDDVIIFNTPEGLTPETYDVEVVWAKNGTLKRDHLNSSNYNQAIVRNAFTVTEYADEATNMSDGQHLEITAHAASYGYDGLNAYELALLHGESETEENWINSCHGRLIKTTWSDLKALRDNSKLETGRWYRIIDYQCTTSQTYTKSAGHQFDILVLATDKNVLNENALACLHEGDTYFSENKARLEAWKLKYHLDNDTTKYVWADTAKGKGVIYYMKDEWSNECPYDFKNIMFQRKITDGSLDTSKGINTYVYTFNLYDQEENVHYDASTVQFMFTNEDGGYSHTFGNIMKPCSESNLVETKSYGYPWMLNNNVFLNYREPEDFFLGCYNNCFDFECHDNTFGNFCYENHLDAECANNTFDSDCNRNKLGDGCCYNMFSNGSSENVLGCGCVGNSIADYCRYNTVEAECFYIVLGIGCTSNSFGAYCRNIALGSYCSYNTFGQGCNLITFGTKDAVKSYISNITIENAVSYVYLNCPVTTSSNAPMRNVHIHSGVYGTSSLRKTITIETAGNAFLTTVGTANDTTINV